MPRIYLTQSELDKIPPSQKTETHIALYNSDKSYPYTIIGPRKTLTCFVCGSQTKGRQWYNRDKGFGICPICYAEEHASAILSRSTQDDLAELRINYGIYGVHFGKLQDFILQS